MGPQGAAIIFKFLNAADLHLDSPLLGLANKSDEFAERIDDASRRAFDNLVELAITEDGRFVIFAGDIFDGDLLRAVVLDCHAA
jgi:DNA repair exonuclease SbcCD nuclease subunit